MTRRSLDVLQTGVRVLASVAIIAAIVVGIVWLAFQAHGEESPAVLYNTGMAEDWVLASEAQRLAVARWHMGKWRANFDGTMTDHALVDCMDKLAQKMRSSVIIHAINCTPPLTTGAVR